MVRDVAGVNQIPRHAQPQPLSGDAGTVPLNWSEYHWSALPLVVNVVSATPPLSLHAFVGTCPEYPTTFGWKASVMLDLSVVLMVPPWAMAATFALAVFVARKPWYPGMCIVPFVVPTVKAFLNIGIRVSPGRSLSRGLDPCLPKASAFSARSSPPPTHVGGFAI